MNVDMQSLWVRLFLAGTIFNFLLYQALELIAWRHRCTVGAFVPPELVGYVEPATLKQSIAYKNARYRLFVVRSFCFVAVSLFLMLSGFYVRLFFALWNGTHNAYASVLLFSLISSIPLEVISIPFDIYREFKIEKTFGFSNMTLRLWLLDSLKGLLVSVFVGLPLVCGAVTLFVHTNRWWLLLGSVYVAFSFLVSFVYPMLIAPLFNKFTPLEDGELKTALESLLTKTGFKAKSLLVMDASKRSGHSNAYFTGFGKGKRIVLYDTLIKQLSVSEIKAVLAHELGHYKKHHIAKKLCIMVPLIFGLLAVLNMLVRIPDLYISFGYPLEPSSVVGGAVQFLGLFLLIQVFSGFLPFVSFVSNMASRHDEFEADRFSAELCGSGQELSHALIVLNNKNLSPVSVPTVYSLLLYSHPPLLERLRALSATKPHANSKQTPI